MKYEDIIFKLFIAICQAKQRCHPLKGPSSKKTPLRYKKIHFFRLTLDGFVKSPGTSGTPLKL